MVHYASNYSYLRLAFPALGCHGTQVSDKPAKTARATVEAILEAAARVLIQHGLDGTSTNHVAREAGVSVGSLYQYFPNKESLVRALLERHLADAEAMRPAALRSPTPLPLRARLRLAIEWQLAAHAKDPELHQMLTLLAPRVMGAGAIVAFERQFEFALAVVLEPYRDQVRPRNLEIAAFILAQCMESLTHGAVIHHPELIGDAELADEITELVAGYLGV